VTDPQHPREGSLEADLDHAKMQAGYEREGIGIGQVLAEQDALTMPKVGDRWSDLTGTYRPEEFCGAEWDAPGGSHFVCERRAHDPADRAHVASYQGVITAVWDYQFGRYHSPEDPWAENGVATVRFETAEAEPAAIADVPAASIAPGTLTDDVRVAGTFAIRRRLPHNALAFLATHLADELRQLVESNPIQPGAVAVNPDGTAYRLDEDGRWAALRPE
jgi:hypothetical protein